MVDGTRACGRCDIYGLSHRAGISMKQPRLFKCVRLLVRNQAQGVIYIYMQEELERIFSNIIPPSLSLFQRRHALLTLVMSETICAHLKRRNCFDSHDTLVNKKKRKLEHQAYTCKIILSVGVFHSVWNASVECREDRPKWVLWLNVYYDIYVLPWHVAFPLCHQIMFITFHIQFLYYSVKAFYKENSHCIFFQNHRKYT